MRGIGLQYCKKHKAVVLPFMGKLPCCIQEEADQALVAVGEAMLVVESAEHKLGVVKEALRKYGIHSPKCQSLKTTLQESELPSHLHVPPYHISPAKINCICGLDEVLGVDVHSPMRAKEDPQ